MQLHKDLQVFHFKTYQDWLDWLAEHYQQSESIWLMFAKKGSGEQSLSYAEAREGALIYGWIDGLLNTWDDKFYLLKFSARRPKSRWSKINRNIVEQLIEEGKMQPSGLKQVELAKQDGRWQAAYDSPSTMQVPDDLAKALTSNPRAKQKFESLNKTQRYSLLYKLQDAHNPALRKKRLVKIVAELGE